MSQLTTQEKENKFRESKQTHSTLVSHHLIEAANLGTTEGDNKGKISPTPFVSGPLSLLLRSISISSQFTGPVYQVV